MSILNRTRPRHGVIDQLGRALDDTARFPRLSYVLGRHPEPVPEAEVTLPLPVVRDPRLAPTTVPSQRMLPLAGARTFGMKVPSSPKPAAGSARFTRNFFETPEIQAIGRAAGAADDAWVRSRHAEDARWSGIFLRLDQALERVHQSAALQDGHALDAAYAAGGTEALQKLTPEVLAAMDERAKAGLAVAR